MEKIKSKLETQTIRVIERSIDLWLVLYAVVSGLVLELINNNDKFIKVATQIVSLFISIAVFYWGKEYFIHFTMKILKIFSDAENDLCGWWEIKIEYKENGKLIRRGGQVQIEKTPIGLTLRGGELFDDTMKNNKGDKVVESWISDFVELRTFNNQKILQYVFRIKRNEDEVMEFSKVGHVLLKSIDSKHYKGTYVDLFIPVGDNNSKEKLRKGDVLLRRG